MKPSPSAPPTSEDNAIWIDGLADNLAKFRWRSALAFVSVVSDRRDAELMLGLTGTAPGSAGICVAYLWLIGCVIHNGTTGTRVAMCGFEQDYGPQQWVVSQWT